MSEHEDVHIDVDPMLFYAMVIEDQVEMIDALAENGLTALMAVVADVAWEQIASAQAELDALIAEDKTWRPA